MAIEDFIYDTITADQIDNGDQIVIDGEGLENVTVNDDPDDSDGIVVIGYSVDDGDKVTHVLPYDYPVSLWSV